MKSYDIVQQRRSIIETACQASIAQSNTPYSSWSARQNKSIQNKRPSADLPSASHGYANEHSSKSNDSSSTARGLIIKYPQQKEEGKQEDSSLSSSATVWEEPKCKTENRLEQKNTSTASGCQYVQKKSEEGSMRKAFKRKTEEEEMHISESLMWKHKASSYQNSSWRCTWRPHRLPRRGRRGGGIKSSSRCSPP